MVRPVGRAELLARGVSRRRLEGPTYRRTGYGLYVPASVARVPVQRIAEAVAVLPAAATLSGWAAAYVFGVDWLDGRDPRSGQVQAVPVLLPPGLHRRSTEELRYERATLAAGEIREILGLRLTAPARTPFDLARTAPDVAGAVVALDAMLAAKVATPDLLVETASTYDRCRGARQLRRAVGLARRHVRSP